MITIDWFDAVVLCVVALVAVCIALLYVVGSVTDKIGKIRGLKNGKGKQSGQRS